MKKVAMKGARSVIGVAKKTLKSNSFTRQLLYDVMNKDLFSDLFKHEQMIADQVRVNTYQAAISKHVNGADNVLDLGTGSGILSIMAARETSGTVHAVDQSDFINVAKKIAAHNGADNIVFVQTNSRDYNPNIKFDVLLHEQMGDECFDENMVVNLLDLKRRVLKPGGRILPNLFELYIEPVSLKDIHRIPNMETMTVHGVDLSIIGELENADDYRNDSYHQRFISPEFVSHALCPPQPLFVTDLEQIDQPEDIASEYAMTRKVTEAGQLDGFCIWFKAAFDDEININTSPSHTPTHWANRLIRVPARQCDAGETLTYKVKLGDLTRPETWSLQLD